MISSYKKFWSNLFNFSGTASRSEYWWAIILNYVLGFIILMIGSAMFDGSADIFYSYFSRPIVIITAIIWIGTLSLRFRRLHDTNHSAWWLLIEFVPVIGTIWYLILMIMPTKSNRWQ
ncbi:DUF805 domain-containing protein [Lactobacillus acetotolerans]|uniref:DUF805 domain-containing protein n=2 Tax=Lactobacillus acetotolerans TaxID=1600 RepID=A0A5P5ZJG0_9LACO|nr:DUF805 domain-containing protein [Lactobacillus acetotolerans]QFG51202.1 DUF805 domain-containing protein [Lactobacillus acetotolerans]